MCCTLAPVLCTTWARPPSQLFLLKPYAATPPSQPNIDTNRAQQEAGIQPHSERSWHISSKQTNTAQGQSTGYVLAWGTPGARESSGHTTVRLRQGSSLKDCPVSDEGSSPPRTLPASMSAQKRFLSAMHLVSRRTDSRMSSPASSSCWWSSSWHSQDTLPRLSRCGQETSQLFCRLSQHLHHPQRQPTQQRSMSSVVDLHGMQIRVLILLV